MAQPKITMTIEGLDKQSTTYIVEKVSPSSSGVMVDLGKRIEILREAGGDIE